MGNRGSFIHQSVNTQVLKKTRRTENSSNMRTFVVALFALAAYVVADADLPPPTPIPILSQTQEMHEDGSYISSFETGNGIQQSVESTIQKGANDTDISVVKGTVSWTDDEGKFRELRFIADDKGYRAEADFLPTPPPVPLPIQRALEYAAAHPELSESEPEA